MSMRRSAIAPTLAAALALTACGVKADPVAVPPGSGESPAPASGGFVGRYTKLNTPCPTLDGTTAKDLKLPATGKPADVNADTPLSQIVSCTWGTGPGSVTVLLTIDRHTGTPTAEQRAAAEFEKDWKAAVDDGRTLSPEPATGIGDKAYLGVHRDRQSLILSLRAGNTQIQIAYGVPDIPPSALATTLDRNRPTLVGLAQDVLNDLT